MTVWQFVEGFLLIATMVILGGRVLSFLMLSVLGITMADPLGAAIFFANSVMVPWFGSYWLWRLWFWAHGHGPRPF